MKASWLAWVVCVGVIGCGGGTSNPSEEGDGELEPLASNGDACPDTSPTRLSTADEYCYDDGIRCGYEAPSCADVFVCKCYEGCGWIRDDAAQSRASCPVPCPEADFDEPCGVEGESCARPGEAVNGPPGQSCTAECQGGSWRIHCPE